MKCEISVLEKEERIMAASRILDGTPVEFDILPDDLNDAYEMKYANTSRSLNYSLYEQCLKNKS